MKEQEKLDSVPICVHGASVVNAVMEHGPVFSERDPVWGLMYLTPYCCANKEIAFPHE